MKANKKKAINAWKELNKYVEKNYHKSDEPYKMKSTSDLIRIISFDDRNKDAIDRFLNTLSKYSGVYRFKIAIFDIARASTWMTELINKSRLEQE